MRFDLVTGKVSVTIEDLFTDKVQNKWTDFSATTALWTM